MDKRTEKRLLIATLERLDDEGPSPWISAAKATLLSCAVLTVGSFVLFTAFPKAIGVPAILVGFTFIGYFIGWLSYRLSATNGWLALKSHVSRESVSARLRELET